MNCERIARYNAAPQHLRIFFCGVGIDGHLDRGLRSSNQVLFIVDYTKGKREGRASWGLSSQELNWSLMHKLWGKKDKCKKKTLQLNQFINGQQLNPHPKKKTSLCKYNSHYIIIFKQYYIKLKSVMTSFNGIMSLFLYSCPAEEKKC